MDTTNNTAPLQVTIHPLPDSTTQGTFWSNSDTPSFKDMLDTINPLQHIPIVSSLYQAMSGDVPAPAPKVLGGALFGGPVGLVASIFDSIIQSNTGSDIAGNMMAAIQGNPIPALQQKNATPETQVALNIPPDHLSPNQRASYNAYVQTQTMMA